jgi:hypothetical protein
MTKCVLFVSLVDSSGKVASFVCDALNVSEEGRVYLNLVGETGLSERVSFDKSIKIYSVYPHSIIT